MKSCNNCGTINDLHTLKCTGCNMPGNFTHLHQQPEEVQEENPQNVQCMNCGTFNPGEDTHCNHCRIPLKRVQVKPISKVVLQANRKVG